MDEVNRRLRGHQFLPTKDVLGKMPKLYTTDGVPAEDKTVLAHYFSAGTDYYITEMTLDLIEGDWVAHGYTVLASQPDGQEWGYTNMRELEAVRGRSPQGLPLIVERDMHWSPVKFNEIQGVNHAEKREAEAAAAPVETPAEFKARTGVTPFGMEPEAQDAEPGPAMQCPECEEVAIPGKPTDLVPYEAHGLDPQHTHRDGTALCPVMGEQGYEPAQPVPSDGAEQQEEPLDHKAEMYAGEGPHTVRACDPDGGGLSGSESRHARPLAGEHGPGVQTLPLEPDEAARVEQLMAGDRERWAAPVAGTADAAFARGWSPDGGAHGLFALSDRQVIDSPADREAEA